MEGEEFTCKYCIDPQLERKKFGSYLWNGGSDSPQQLSKAGEEKKEKRDLENKR